MIPNAVSSFRALLAVPVFGLLAFGGSAWIALALFLSARVLGLMNRWAVRAQTEPAAFGAMMALLGDRLLTLAAVLGLIFGSQLPKLYALPGIVLIVGDLMMATLSEALPGRPDMRLSIAEKLKIATAIAGLSLLMSAEGFFRMASMQAADLPDAPDSGWGMAMFGAATVQSGAIALAIAAVLTLVTLPDYWRRVLTARKDQAGLAESGARLDQL